MSLPWNADDHLGEGSIKLHRGRQRPTATQPRVAGFAMFSLSQTSIIHVSRCDSSTLDTVCRYVHPAASSAGSERFDATKDDQAVSDVPNTVCLAQDTGARKEVLSLKIRRSSQSERPRNHTAKT